MRLVGVYVWVGTGTVWQRCRGVCVSYRSISVWIKYFKMLSVSMMVDRKRSPKPWKILPRLPSSWLDDSRSDACFDCGSVFGLMLRKHHCRSCGRLFCRFCLKKGLIPFSYSSFVARYSKDPVWMCHPCLTRMSVAWKSEDLMTVLACLPITWFEMLQLRLVSKHWHGAVNTLISIWRSLLYRLHIDNMNGVEVLLLKNHALECGGHYPWAILASRYCPQILFQAHSRPCKHLFCSRQCSSSPSLLDLVALMYTPSIRSLEVRKWLCHHLASSPVDAVLDTMLWWVHLCNQYKDVAIDFFIPYVAATKSLAFSFYFLCKRRSYRQHLLDICVFSSDIVHADTTILTLIRVLKTGKRELIQPFVCPWKTDMIFVRLLSVTAVRSHSKPFRLVFESDKKKEYSVLVKFQNMRRDYLVSIMLSWCVRLKIGKPIFYRVFEYSNHLSFVEMIPNACTLYKVNVEHKMSLEHYILGKNRSWTISQVRNRFLESLVMSVVLAYVLGVGDRHLENILVTDRAELIHIDFEYLFGAAPFGQRFKRNSIRLTKEMVDVLGGVESADYERFKIKTAECFQAFRKYMRFWYHLFSWIGHEKMAAHFVQIFQPGEFDAESSYCILNNIEASESIMDHIMDIAHSIRIKLV